MTTFLGGVSGAWRVLSIASVKGDGLLSVQRLSIQEASPHPSRSDSGGEGLHWVLRGVRSHLRYVERSEKARLDELSPPLGRSPARRAGLIPIRKSPGLSGLPEDQRRAI